MDFNGAIYALNTQLLEEKPSAFNTSWILERIPAVYRYIHKNVRTENDEIDWDTITRALDREFQKHWSGRRPRRKKAYENQDEVGRILAKYDKKLYVFISSMDDKDRHLRDTIIIALVRVAQKGNILAEQEAVSLVRYTVDDWVEKFYVLSRWVHYSDLLDEHLAACVRRYRFTGSFLGYVFKTLQYAGRGLRYTYSLDKETYPGHCLAQSVVQDSETGEARFYDRTYDP